MANEKTFADIYFDSTQWLRILGALQKKWKDIENRKEFGGIVSSVVYENIMEHFEKEQGPKEKWPEWSPSYLAAIQGRVAFRKIRGRTVPLDPYTIQEWGLKPPRRMGKKLQATGRLRQSFTPNKWKGTPEGILFFNNAKTKSGFPYAAAHDEGGPNLPQRKFMWLSATGIKKLVDLTLKWLAE